MVSLEQIHALGNDDDDDDDDSNDDSSRLTGTATSSSTSTTSNSDEENDLETDDDDDDETTAIVEKDDIDIDMEESGAKIVALPVKNEGLSLQSRAFQLPQVTTGISTVPPKMRIKLSLRLPTKANKGKTSLLRKETKSVDVQTATIAASDDENEAVAEVVSSSAPSAITTTVPLTTKPAKRKLKPVRVPAMSSPGLLLPPSSGIFRGEADTNGFSSPASVFDHCMILAGYTMEERMENPHRGSSVKRSVGDMFDSDVKLTQNFPKLIPKELMVYQFDTKKKSETFHDNNDDNDDDDDAESMNTYPLVKMLVKALTSKDSNSKHEIVTDTSLKRKRPWSFQDMIPLSLTIPYPESYCKERLEYVKAVETREAIIIAAQETILETEKIKERYKEEVARKSVADMPAPPALPKSIEVPPIPEPPAPPRLTDLTTQLDMQLDDTKHPLYPPKNNTDFVTHLDPNCFHISEGRYFGLLTNLVSDPHFIGPSAPGITGLTVSAGTSLATSYVGHQSAGSASLASTVYGNSSVTTPTKTLLDDTAAVVEVTAVEPMMKKVTTQGKIHTINAPKLAPKALSKKEHGPAQTSSSSDLKKLMETPGELADAMRRCIVRAAVFASRNGRHGQSFVGSNGQVYPDVARAFAAWADMRPCDRCKNNKQGAYHCRLRRKHKELDHDGGNSPALLAPLFLESMEDLLSK